MPITLPAFMYELQVAVQARLTGDATLMSIITGVFDIAPEGQAYPYITYGQHVTNSWEIFGKVNGNGLFLLDIFSQQGSDDECYTILSHVQRLVQTRPGSTPLTLPSYTTPTVLYDWSTILKEPDYNVRHMPVRYRVKAIEI